MNFNELIICILVTGILAAAVFLGGSAMINSSQLSVAENDLKNFEVLANQMLFENLDLQTAADASGVEALFNKYLPDEMKLTSGVSVKKDPWGNNYNVTYSITSHSDDNEFYIIITGGGKNNKIDLTKLDSDDVGIIILLRNGDVTSEKFGFKTSKFDRTGKKLTDIVIGVD